jgi:hypothetical protein
MNRRLQCYLVCYYRLPMSIEEFTDNVDNAMASIGRFKQAVRMCRSRGSKVSKRKSIERLRLSSAFRHRGKDVT